MIPVIWQSYNPERSARLFGDQIMFNDLFKFNGEYEIQPSFKEYDGFNDFYNSAKIIQSGSLGAIVMMALEDNKDYIDQLNKDISNLSWCLVILTQNEYGSKAYQDIRHPNMKLWLQTPAQDDVADKFIPLGYPSIVKDHMNAFPDERKYDWFFSGQISHQRRKECAKAVEGMPNGIFIGTEGFNEGLDYYDYINYMINSKIVICPAGPETPDTFRVYEALEAGCIPIIDIQDGHGKYRKDFWIKIFGEDFPIAQVNVWDSIDDVIEMELNNYSYRSGQINMWWRKYKRQLSDNIFDTVHELGKNK